MNQYIFNKLKNILSEEDIYVDEMMNKHTTFKIGGPADFLVTPSVVQDVLDIVHFCKLEKIPYEIIGNGSNLLVGDLGFKGIIVKISNKMSYLNIDKGEDGKSTVRVGAGISLSKLAAGCAKESLTGLEFMSGIPGTLGGAVTMNAGAYGGEIKDKILSVIAIDENDEIAVLSREEMNFGYRKSAVCERGLVILEAEFVLEEGTQQEIYDMMKELNAKRREKQPTEYPSAGSTFKRPTGYFAGKLIMEAGLAGYSVGDIKVSEKHCGFVINTGNGTAKEVLQLMDDVKRIVHEKYDVYLEPEIRMIGEF